MKPVEPYWYVLTKEYALLVSGQFQLELNGPLLFFNFNNPQFAIFCVYLCWFHGKVSAAYFVIKCLNI